MAGTIIADTWQNGDGTQNYKCRAWVNFNGTGTVAIRASGNVSSITDRGVGVYTVNFTTAMPDANYCAHMSKYVVSTWNDTGCEIAGATTTACYIGNVEGAAGYDSPSIYVSVFR